VEDEIKRLGTKYNVNSHVIRSALTEADRDKQADLLSKVTDTFNDRDKLSLFKLADDAKEITRRRSVLQSDVKQALEYIEAKRSAEKEKTLTERKTEWNGAQKTAWKTISDTLYLARPLEDNDAWNQGLEQTKSMVASTNLDELTSVDRAKVLVQAALLPRAVMAIHQVWNMYQEAHKALQRYQGVTPGAGSGSSSGGETGNGAQLPNGSEEHGMSFIDAIESKLGTAKR
jgi:ribosomal protein S20